jgi:hypothetical protein
MRVYSIINYVILTFIGYFFSMPLYSDFMYEQFPNLWTCPYKRITGHPCLFCGFVEDMGALFNSNINVQNPIVVYVLSFLVFEVFFRVALVLLRRNKIVVKNRTKVVVVDVLIHYVVLILFIEYIVSYF